VERQDRRDKRRQYWVIEGPVRRTTLGCATSPRGKEAVTRQCWVPAEGVFCPQASHTPRHPCRSKGKYWQRSRQGRFCEEPLRERGSRRHTGSVRNAVSALGTEA
jgi:hypothetical protein